MSVRHIKLTFFFDFRVLRPGAVWRVAPALVGMAVSGCSPHHSASGTTAAAPNAVAPVPPPVSRLPDTPAARRQLAEQYAASGETYAAIEQLEAARQTGDASEGLALWLADLYGRLNEPEAAIEALQRAASAPPATPDARLALSHALLKAGRFAQAAEALRPLLAACSAQSVPVQQFMARALLLAGDTGRAGRVIPVESSDPDWLALQGLRAQLLGQPKAGADVLARARTLRPQDGWYAYLLGRSRLAVGDSVGAIAAFQSAADLPDAPPQPGVAAAQLLAQTNRLDDAVALLQRLPGTARSLPAYWQAQALLAQKGRQPVLAQIARGYAAYHSGDPWQAEAIWRAALPRANKEDAWALYTALLNSAAQRQDRASLQVATAAVGRFPHDYYLLKSRAELLLEQNARAEALTVARQLPALEPQEQAGQAADLLARIAIRSGLPDLLHESVRRERAQATRDPSALLHLIEWQRRQQWTHENLASTLKLCQEAIALAPDNAEAHFRAGEALQALQRPQEAMAMLRHCLTLSPRLHDGAPNVLLAHLEQRAGLMPESRYELQRMQRLNRLRDPWPARVALLYRDRPEPGRAEWKALARLALDRHEAWVALCAATRAGRVAPGDPICRALRAEALSRLGRPDEALSAMSGAHDLPIR